MGNKSYSAKSSLVRVTPDDLVRMLSDAEELMEGPREEALQEQRATLVERYAGREGIGDAQIESQVQEYARTYVHKLPRWFLSTRKGDVSEHQEGRGEDIVDKIAVPKVHRAASVTVESGSNSIRIWLGQAGGSIEISSSDDRWFRMAKAWADEALRDVTPRWRWLPTTPVYVLLLGLGLAIASVSAYVLVRNPTSPSISIVGIAIGLVVVASGLAVTYVPRTVVGPRRQVGAINIFRLTIGYAVAGVVGWIIGRVGDAVFPTQVP